MSDLTVEQQLKQIAALQTPVTNVYRRKIPAAVGGVAGETVIDSPGHYFYVKESDQTCLYQMDDGREQPFDVGTGPNTRGLGMFKKLTIKNIFAQSVTVEIVIGLGEFTDNRFTLVPSRDFALPVYDGFNVTIGWNGTSIAGGAHVDFNGIPVLPLITRRSLSVSNLDPTARLKIKDRNGNFCAAIEPKSSHIMFTADFLSVVNDTGGNIETYISEVWYRKLA